jgi:hypothetical protein
VRHIVIIALAALAAACTSPEAERVRGGGPGADRGNRGPVALMHEGSKPYAGTPTLIPEKRAPIDSANHADQLSRP